VHQGIFNSDPTASNIGVVAVELSSCAVMLWPGLSGWTGPWNIKSYWWTATGITGMGSNKLILSVVVHDVSYNRADPVNPSTSNVWPWPFSTAVAVYSDSNALVANSQVAAARSSPGSVSPTFKFSNGTLSNVTVSYPIDNRYGIDVNQILLGACVRRIVCFAEQQWRVARHRLAQVALRDMLLAPCVRVVRAP